MPERSPAADAVTYAAVGATLGDGRMQVPAGFRPTSRDVVLGAGPDVFERAAAATMRWQIQKRAGHPACGCSTTTRMRDRSELDDVVIMRVPLWPRDVPCRVVAVVDEPDPQGIRLRHPARASGERRGGLPRRAPPR